jgi:hypothetical protein
LNQSLDHFQTLDSIFVPGLRSLYYLIHCISFHYYVVLLEEVDFHQSSRHFCFGHESPLLVAFHSRSNVLKVADACNEDGELLQIVRKIWVAVHQVHQYSQVPLDEFKKHLSARQEVGKELEQFFHYHWHFCISVSQHRPSCELRQFLHHLRIFNKIAEILLVGVKL